MMTHDEIVNDVHSMIMKEWTEKDKKDFFLGPYKDEYDLHLYHHSVGRWIRNHYNLWSEEWVPELKDGVDYSPNHPDARSMRIITDVWKRGYHVTHG